MPDAEWNIVLTLGVLLSTALAGGFFARILRLPQVTAYLLVGLALGPHIAQVISEEHLTHLEPLGNMAMALVLFNMGCHFRFGKFRHTWRRALRFSASEISLTFFMVAGGLFLFGLPWQATVLFGALAIATAPATTTLVLQESASEGPVTEFSTVLVALNNLAAVLVFELLLVGVQMSQGAGHVSIAHAIRSVAADLAGSIALGLIGGLMLSYACGLWPRGRWLAMLVAVSTLLLGACSLSNIPYLLTFLAMGVTVANASDRSRDIVAELDRMTGLLCVVFFVINGAHLDPAALKMSGVVGLGFIALRAAGKYLGPYLAANAHQDGPQVRRWLGATLWSQAGAAIALSAIAADPATGLGELGKNLQIVVLGSIVFFEILGPIAIRQAVYRAGEIPLDHAIHHTTTTPWEELRSLVNQVVVALGFNPWQRRPAEQITVGELMRRNVKGIPAAANFDEVVEFIEHSRDNTFPVVGDNNEIVGVIRYTDLRDAMFDPDLGDLVCAADLATPVPYLLKPNEEIALALELFRESDDDCAVVATVEQPRCLVGIVKRRDLFRFFLKSGSRTDN